MQHYTKIQKFTSFFLIFSLLFSFTINVSFFSFLWTIFASDAKHYNLVSIFVQEEIYPWVRNSLNTYARNIQGVLENTKTMIIPIPGDTHPFNIASLNEKLYFEWYEWLDGLKWISRLVGTVFIWDIALPVVENGGSYEKTVFPYVDFEEKLYIYNENEKLYTLNKNSIKTPKAEIWHGFISPNTGNLGKDIQEINDYFSKNNDFYQWVWLFQNEKWLMNGNLTQDLIENYEPYVFYYDQIRESKAVKYVEYNAYEAYLTHKEDLMYNRFSKELTEKLKDHYFQWQSDYIWDLGSIFWENVDLNHLFQWPTTLNIPDIQLRHIIENTTRNFLQIFNGSTLWEMRKHVHNAGRYNMTPNTVNVDLIPTLITSLDTFSQSSVKNVNTDLEKIIDDIVKNGFSRDIAIPSKFEIGTGTYINFLYGMQWWNIATAGECSFYRGSTYAWGQLVESNRAFNIQNVQGDIDMCQRADTRGYWWGNSPVNLNVVYDIDDVTWVAPQTQESNIYNLHFSDYTNAIVPLFDDLWSLQSKDTTKNPDPRMCFNNNLLLTEIKEGEDVIYSVPVNGNRAVAWSCNSTNIKFPYNYTFDQTYKNFPTLEVEPCDEHNLILDGQIIKSYVDNNCGGWWRTGAGNNTPWNEMTSSWNENIKNYHFHKISSWIEHKAPNSDELYKQTQYMISPNLPIDKDRYIDFIAADDTYAKIKYPYLFRLGTDTDLWFNLQNAKNDLKVYLDQKSREINELIQEKNPSKLTGMERQIYELLKNGDYPQANIDLYAELLKKPDQELDILWEKKTLSYVDTVVFSILWNNLTSVSAKYAFVFENYLSDQFGGNDFNFYLPKNKRQYEIAYLWAPWDPQNMYIKLDPEEKWENPYLSIIQAHQALNTQLFTIKDIEENSDALFKCAPPEWVPIWEWIPAVMCRLKDMLPPKIRVSEWNCWLNTMNFWLYNDDSHAGYCTDCNNTDTYDFTSTPTIDINKNGIPDILEKEIKEWTLSFTSDSIKYPYNKTWFLEAQLLDTSGARITTDSFSYINFELIKLEIPNDESKEFTQNNRKVIFDQSNERMSDEIARKNAEKYLNFRDINVRLNRGQLRYNFSTKSSDANVTLKATLILKWRNGEIIETKQKTLDFQVRGDMFSISTYKLSSFAGELVLDSLKNGVVASQSNNIFVMDERAFLSQKSNLASLNSYSPAKEKLFLTLSHTDKRGNTIPITYPLSVNVYNEKGEKIIDTLSLSSASQAFPVWKFQNSGVYTLEIKDAKSFTFKKQISVLPDVAVKIDPQLSTNIMEKGWVITTHVFSLYDQFDNPTIGEIYTIEAQISGNSIVFENGQKTQTFQVYDGYRAFRLKSTPIAWNANITFTLKLAEKTIDTKTRSLSVVDKIEFVLTGVPAEIKVGNQAYPYTLQIKNQIEGSSFNSRAYLITKWNYITSKDTYINIQNGKATSSFQTKTKAGEKVQLEFKIEWVKESVYQEIDILPDVGLKVDLTLSKGKIEASSSANSILYAEIKDRYGNIVWNDNQTVLSLEILPQYRHIITSNTLQVQSQNGRGAFVLRGSNIPGTAYFKVSTSPNLAENKIEIPGQTHFKKEKLDTISGMRQDGILTELGKKFFTDYDLEHYRFIYFDKTILQSSEDFQAQNPLTQRNLLSFFGEHNKIIISWLGENAGKIETFYFWNKQKIDGNKYNSIYTTLLGAGYGDITIPDNLANSLIFDKENRALWVTTLLSDTTKYNEVLNIHPSGNLKLNHSAGDISQDLRSSVQVTQEGDLEVSFVNNTFDSLISKVYYNIKNPELIDRCGSFQISDCFDKNRTSLVLVSKNSHYMSKWDEKNGLRLFDAQNQNLLEITANGKIVISREIQFELSKNNTTWLLLDVKVGNQVIAHFALYFPKNDIKIVRNTALFPEVKDAQTNWGMLVYLEGRDYFFKESYLGSSTKEEVGYIISYNDPFGSTRKTHNQFWAFFEFWYERFDSKAGIGWQEDNKILLSFAAGKTIGQATKDFMSFSLINIGDPVASLKPIHKKLPGTQKTRKYDATIWYLISNDDDTIWYDVFDYNNDKNEDIAILKRGGYIQLLEGTDVFWDFIDRGNLVYIADISPKSPILTGDFFGDGYEDMILLSKNREIIVVSNTQKDFQRISHNIETEGNINQMITFDMDLDGKMDIVILDDLWNLYVFYWWNTPGRFEKKLVDTGLWVILNEEARKQWWAVYFDGLYQIPRDKTEQNVLDSEALLQELQNNRQNLQKTQKQDQNGFNEGLIDKLIFTQMNYTPISKRASNPVFDSMPLPVFTPEMLAWIQAQENSLNSVITTLSGGSTLTSPPLSWWIGSIENGIQNTITGMEDLLNNYNNIWVEWTQLSNILTTFLRSEYAEYQWLEISKQYTDINGAPLRGGDSIELKITIKNTTSQTLRDIAYVEKIHDMFSISENSKYSLKIWNQNFSSEEIVLLTSPSSEYTFILEAYKTGERKNSISLRPWEILEFHITLTTKPFEYGHIDAGFFDTTTEHGDIIFKDKDENCGKEVGLYKSIAKRDYVKDVHAPSCENNLPDDVAENAIDADGNGIPDYIDNLLNASQWWNIDDLEQYAKENLDQLNNSKDYDSKDFMNSLDKIHQNMDDILAWIDTILAGLNCWFWWGSCISSPLNWAPLAPWQDPTLFWMPIGDGLKIDEWMPIFSAINWKRVGKKCVPMPWPPAKWLPWCFWSGAWWRLWIHSPTNFIRIFVTPTLTWSVWMAVCFWAPPSVAWMSNPPWLHPFIPWWNCVVAATPLLWCKNDGSDGEIHNMWNPNDTIINGNCSASETGGKSPYLWEVAQDYIQYKSTGNKSGNLEIDLKEIFSTVASWPAGTWQLPDRPLLNIWDGNNPDLEVSLDFWALQEGNFQDVLNIQMKRISPFPDYVMEWVTRQIEEIANKLTDFPTLYIILPDFKGVFDNDFNFFIDGLKNAYSSGEQKSKEKQAQTQAQIDSQKWALNQKNCEEDSAGCLMDNLEISKLEAQKSLWNNQTVWGIKAAYEFLSSMPILKIEPQKVDFNIPWIDGTTIDKAIADFEATKRQWTEEIQRAQQEWNLENYACMETSSNEGCKVLLNAQNLINSIDRNIEILESYKNIPEDVFKMVKIKDVRIEQILCNLETISQIMWGRIGENGKRFKAWVELYVLIKAILKSWQLLVDVFIDYDAECHECKNERYDLLYFIWKLISMVLPKIPVIQFPKWPDIYLDLHNIRVLLLILIPEFEFNLRPILLPTLPNLYLPNSPNVNIHLPSLPLLPEFELPTLPDLPSLPTVELPNLPPPPKLPKLLSVIEAYLNILKLITKAMCILKTSPFVPEWRAGDQIAFITERTGYLSIDFLDISLPQFSFPFVDAIKVTTYVNLEFEVEFLVEMARQMALPINVFGNDIANMINISLWDLDFRGALPENIDIHLDTDGASVDMSYTPAETSQKVSLFDLASVFALNILKWYSSMKDISTVELSNEEFKKEIAKQLPNIENEKIQWVWQNALNYSFAKENELIETLLLNNEMKYQEIKSILQQEKYENIEVMSSLQEKLSKPQPQNILMTSEKDEKYTSYNTRLQTYNDQAKNAVRNLFVEDIEVKEIRQESREILAQVSHWLSSFSSDLEKSKQAFEYVEIKSNQLLSSNIPSTPISPTPVNTPSQAQTSSGESCALGTMNGYNYVYKGIYIIEKFLNRNISYYLFDYLDELTGKEVVKEFDFDGDGDKDIIYMVGTQIYLKQNYLSKKQAKSYYTGSPIILTSGKNPYLKWDFISAVNGFREAVSDSGVINIWLNASDNKFNYRIEFFPIVDKFDDMILGYLSSYVPKNIKKYIIDGFASIDTITLDMEKTSQSSFIVRKNLASIQSLTNLPGIQLYTKELKSLKDDIASNAEITINAGTKIYAGKDAARIHYYFYNERNKELKMREARLNAGTNLEFKEDIVIIGITGEVFVEGSSFVTLTGNQIANYLKKPLLPGTQITYRHLEVARGNPSLTIEYYDRSEAKIDFNETQYYELYDLGRASQNYSLRTQIENDFYYAKIRSFQNRLFSTYSNQILLAPQNEADNKAPEISNMISLKVPVYQQKVFDISDFIFENSGNQNIKDIFIDFDLNVDSDGNGNKINDMDFSLGNPRPGFTISKEGTKILLKIGPFDRLMNKPIRLYVVDGNNNVWARNIQFSVYSPIPRIENITNHTITWILNENLLREPVSFYRLRNNTLTRLEDVNKNKTTETFEWGRFSFQVPTGWSGLTISFSGETLLRVNEETGKISMSDIAKIKHKLDMRVYPSNNRNNEFAYPKIMVTKDNVPIYYQYLVAPNTGQVEIVRSFSEVIEWWYRANPWVYYLHQAGNNFEYFRFPMGIENNSGDMYIYSQNDTQKQPLFSIYKDGRVHTLWDLYYLEYTSYGEYVVYNLKRIGMETIIGRVMIIPEKNYIVK